MEKKALQLASVASMIDQFTIPNIKVLQSLGYQVDVVADFTNPGTITHERALEIKNKLKEMHVRVFDVNIPRSIRPQSIYTAYKAVQRIIKNEKYNIVHCHSPIGGAICRLATKKERNKGTKVLYTAHGFHFYTGAPLINWIIYYPIEKILSKYTDVLITINKEDYKLAKKSFRASKVKYVPGIGIDLNRFIRTENGYNRIRSELAINRDRIMLLSVGELNVNKNHETVIKAIKGLNLTYVIVGKGELKEHLQLLANQNDVDLRLMGYRTDISDFYSAADVFILPSFREGLNVSLMEAMSSGLAVTCGRIRGNTDLVNAPLFSPSSKVEMRKAILDAIKQKKVLGEQNKRKILGFSTDVVDKKMLGIYRRCE